MMKNLPIIRYYIPFIILSACYIIQYGIKIVLNNPENFDPINQMETSKQFVLIMGSLAGFSLLIMGFLMFEISSSNLKKIDIQLLAKTDAERNNLIEGINEENESRKETVTVFLTCLLVNLTGAVIAAIVCSDDPGTSNRALSAYLSSASFMILSLIFILIGIARMIDTFQIEKAKRFFSNIVLTFLLLGLIEFAGAIDDATTVNNEGQLWQPIIISIAVGFSIAMLLYFFVIPKGVFAKKKFTTFSFFCILVGVSIFAYTELFVREEFGVKDATSKTAGYVLLFSFSAVIGSAFPYLVFDTRIFDVATEKEIEAENN